MAAEGANFQHSETLRQKNCIPTGLLKPFCSSVLMATDAEDTGGGLGFMLTLITNNSDLFYHVKAAELVDGSSLDVLIRVRSLVHLGSRIMTHPLCGNLRPSHQPFRSVLIDSQKGSAEMESLSMIEEAVHVYESCKLITPNELDEKTRADYAYIDSELMRESLEQYGLITHQSLKAAPLLLMKEE